MVKKQPTAYNTAYTLRANAIALRDIAPYGRNAAYAGNERYIKLRALPCEKLLNATIIGESDGTNINL